MPKEPASARRASTPVGVGEAAPRQTREDEAVDSLFDVPAAVLCAFCGEADCAGCLPTDEGASGVVAIVPWERPVGGTWSRLWATANATTHGAEAFFSALPDGEVSPALRFALLCELLAISSIVAVVVPIVAIAAPNLAIELVQNPDLRASALRWMLVGVPAVALWMVAAHATHGAALDVGARTQDARPMRRRALRFGLYACGWDLMSAPIGAFVTLVSKGVRAAIEAVTISWKVPGQASVALLEGVYGLRGEGVRKARRAGTAAAIGLVIVSSAVVGAIMLMALLRFG